MRRVVFREVGKSGVRRGGKRRRKTAKPVESGFGGMLARLGLASATLSLARGRVR